MADIVLFKPREALSAEQQVREFIKESRRITAFDHPADPLDWDALNWGRWLKISFTKLGVNTARLRSKGGLRPDEIMDNDFIDFAKAYTIYCQALNTTKDIKETPALRALEAALLDLRGRADITLADEAVFDQAAEVIRLHFSKARAYHIGGALQKVAAFVSSMKLIPKALVWKSPIKRNKDARGHRDRAEDALKRLPSQASLNALAEIFSNRPTAARDVFTTSAVGMLMCAPSRIGELVEAVVDCHFTKKTKDGKEELFARWYGEKGFGHHHKPIPETVAFIFPEAVARVAEITEEGRTLARFLEDHPDEFPPHPDCPKVGKDRILSPEQCLEALQIVYPEGKARSRLRKHIDDKIKALTKDDLWKRYPKTWALLHEALDGMPKLKGGGPNARANDTYTLTLTKLNTMLREWMLPPHFPYVSDKKITKFSDALFCFLNHQVSEDTSEFTVQRYNLFHIDNNTVTRDIGKAANKDLNLFARWGYNGDEYLVTSHQFRHWLNTLAQKGHAGQVEIARWSGRADISHNRVYNHRSPDDEVKDMRKVGLGSQQTNLAERSRKKQPILVTDIGGRDDRIAHHTLYGLCEHDFSMEPCQKYRGCITCKKHKCIKGDEEKLRRVRFERDKIKVELDKALAAAEKSFDGADRWLEKKMKLFEAANQLIALLEDPEIPEGSVIQAVDDGFTPLKQALVMRDESQAIDKPALAAPQDKKAQDMKRLMGMLGR
ncbi:MAG: hypothetical protein OQK12_05915 [Motiliproteus sp.]|nr:hypothetical protein [Motiliproteus sp.]MCW9050970.1 hypothetical protein [Motiliproteus sp.]